MNTAKKIINKLGKKIYTDNKVYSNCNIDNLPRSILVKVLSR